MIMKVLAWPNPCLSRKADFIPRELFDKASELSKSMMETMEHEKGIGLAAPQVGESLRLFIVDLKHIANDDRGVVVFCNPQIKPIGIEKSTGEEGCLSLKGMRAEVERFREVEVTWDCPISGESFTEVFSGMASICIQHENDHLDGIVYPDRLSPLKRQRFLTQLAKIRKVK